MKKPSSIIIIAAFQLVATCFPGASAATQTVHVEAIPGDPEASGNALIAAVNGLIDPSSQNRFLIKVGPGSFYLGNQGLDMRPWVALEGSGRELTIIKAEGTDELGRGTINAATNSEIRDLRVEASHGIYNTAILCQGDFTAARITRVTTWTANGIHCWGVRYVGSGANSFPELTDSEVRCICSGSTCGVSASGKTRPLLENLFIRTLGATSEASNLGTKFDLDSQAAKFKNVDVTTGDAVTPGIGVLVTDQYVGEPDYDGIGFINSKINSNGGIGLHLQGEISTIGLRSSKIAKSRIALYSSAASTSHDYNEITSIFSQISGTEHVAFCDGEYFQLIFEHSKLEGGPLWTSNNCQMYATCSGVTDEDAKFYSNMCPF